MKPSNKKNKKAPKSKSTKIVSKEIASNMFNHNFYPENELLFSVNGSLYPLDFDDMTDLHYMF